MPSADDEELDDLTECSICLKTFADPRILQCFHTFCFQCLKDYASKSNKKPDDRIPCPTCRSECTIPKDGISALPKNFFMQRLIGLTKKKSTSDEESALSVCDICRNCAAVGCCTECELNLSKVDVRRHRATTVTKCHQVVGIGGHGSKDRRVTFAPAERCIFHPTMSLDAYCSECDELICVACTTEIHRHHAVAGIRKVADQFFKELGTEIATVSAYENLKKPMLTEIEEQRQQLLSDLTENKAEIRERFEELKGVLEKQMQSMVGDLSSLTQKGLEDLEASKEELERQFTTLALFRTHCNNLISKGTLGDICRRKQGFRKNSQILVSSLRKRKISSLKVSFKRPRYESFDVKLLENSLKEHLVGRIEGQTETVSQFEANAILIGLDTVDGVTDDVISVNLYWPNEIYDFPKISTRSSLEAAAAEYNNCVFVSGIGWFQDEIWKYSSTSGWTHCGMLSESRSRHCVAFVDGTLYICGGVTCHYGKEVTTNSIKAFNAMTNSCTIVGQLMYSVEYAACVAYNGFVYVFGGMDEYQRVRRSVQVFDTQRNTCTLLPKRMPSRRCKMRAVVWETSVILLGNGSCFVYDFEKETWYERKQFKTDLVHFGLVIENGVVFVIGGGIKVTSKDGLDTWTCSDEVRCVPVMDIISNSQTAKWRVHCRLPKPAFIHAYAKMTLNGAR